MLAWISISRCNEGPHGLVVKRYTWRFGKLPHYPEVNTQLLQPRWTFLQRCLRLCAISVRLFLFPFPLSPFCRRPPLEITSAGEYFPRGKQFYARNAEYFPAVRAARAKRVESVRWRKVGNYWHGLELTGC